MAGMYYLPSLTFKNPDRRLSTPLSAVQARVQDRAYSLKVKRSMSLIFAFAMHSCLSPKEMTHIFPEESKHPYVVYISIKGSLFVSLGSY